MVPVMRTCKSLGKAHKPLLRNMHQVPYRPVLPLPTHVANWVDGKGGDRGQDAYSCILRVMVLRGGHHGPEASDLGGGERILFWQRYGPGHARCQPAASCATDTGLQPFVPCLQAEHPEPIQTTPPHPKPPEEANNDPHRQRLALSARVKALSSTRLHVASPR